jgi:hypothetical protein
VVRFQWLFAALILTQAAHSVEEYTGELYRSFPPARFVSSLISSNHELGFAIANLVIVAFGGWCALVPVARSWPSARAIAGVWAAVELVNGIGHLLWSAYRGGYTPGVATAPVLLVVALLLTRELRRSDQSLV